MHTCRDINITLSQKIHIFAFHILIFITKSMKYPIHLLTLVFLLSFNQSYGQFGVRLKYNNNGFDNLDRTINTQFSTDKQVFKSGFEGGIDYWFRLKKRRVEFMPELAYSYAVTGVNADRGLDNINYTGYNFNFHTHFYALDMEGDCNCPTFSKQGPSINKGLFFHFTPGIGYYQFDAKTNGGAAHYEADEGIVFRGGIGLGMDIGFSDLFTITPILSYYFHTKITWDGVPVYIIEHTGVVPVNQRQLQFTVRLGFSPDYTSGRRR